MQKLPIGYDNFRELIDNQLDFIDKSLFIRDLLDDTAKVAVILRPRRFGKTLNLSMLHYFLAAQAYRRPTAGLFDGLKINQAGEQYLFHQGKYPVIFVTFKDINTTHFSSAIEKLTYLIRRLFSEHAYLHNSDKLNESQKKSYASIFIGQPTPVEIENSLVSLTECLFTHHGVKPWLLIDEYDSPMQSAYVHGYFDEMVSFMRGLLGAVLKTNPYLNRAVITGILRIAKENLFSGVNNLEVYSTLRPEYAEYFGFTETEVQELLKNSQLKTKITDIRNWYNGYQIDDITLYNPWSIVNCLKQKGNLSPYWVNTSDNQLIHTLLVKSSSYFKEAFETLLQSQPIKKIINEEMVFADLIQNEKSAWSLLVSAGYLKVLGKQYVEEDLKCELTIPNREVQLLYRRIIKEWLGGYGGSERFTQFLNYLLAGNLDAFERDFRELMEQSISHHDTAKQPEAFYHGFMLGLTASLYYDPNYELYSNRESGYGRYDYLIISKDKNKPTVLLEFKKAEPVKDSEQLILKLQQEAQNALAQIKQHHYTAQASQSGCTQILKIGLAFSGKYFEIASESTGIKK